MSPADYKKLCREKWEKQKSSSISTKWLRKDVSRSLNPSWFLSWAAAALQNKPNQLCVATWKPTTEDAFHIHVVMWSTLVYKCSWWEARLRRWSGCQVPHRRCCGEVWWSHWCGPSNSDVGMSQHEALLQTQTILFMTKVTDSLSFFNFA